MSMTLLFIILVVAVVLAQAILLWPRLRDERLRREVLQLQAAALRAKQAEQAEEASSPASADEDAASASLLHRNASLATEPADPYWDALLRYADRQ